MFRDLEAAAIHWDWLSTITENPHARQTYRTTAAVIRWQIETNISLCVCCLKPMGSADFPQLSHRGGCS